MIVTCTSSGPVRPRLILHELLVVWEFDKYCNLKFWLVRPLIQCDQGWYIMSSFLHRELVPIPLIVSGVGNYGDVTNLNPTTCSAQLIVGLGAQVQTRPDHRDGLFKQGWYPTGCARKIVGSAQMVVFMSRRCWGVGLVSNTPHSE